jgi:hypothetical protein
MGSVGNRVARARSCRSCCRCSLDEGRVLDGRDELELPAAAAAAFDVDGEHAFQAPHPGHGHVFRDGPLVVGVVGARRGRDRPE